MTEKMDNYQIEMCGISKKYPGVKALDDVNISVKRGEVHALAGKNGAGKSTLIKILGGSVRPDSGEILIAGKSVKLSSPHDSISNGIAIISQELMLIQDLSVAENILLGNLPVKKTGQVDWDEANRLSNRALSQLGIAVDLSAKIKTLSTAQQQGVEIAKALSRKAEIIVMDEPTSSLANKEVDHLLEIIRRLSSQGKTIIYITHKLNEIFAIADRISVLRDGKYIATKETVSTTSAEIVNLMVGKNLDNLFEKKNAVIGSEPALELKKLTREPYFTDVSLKVQRGEIIGIAGVLGSGRTEILRVIFGCDPYDSGEILVNGKKIDHPTINQMIELGVVLAPEDRKRQGLVLSMNIQDNMNLASIPGIFRRRDKEKEKSRELFSSLSVQAPSISTLVGTLSGGNQQKIVLAKWLATDPQIILLDEPTRGIDIGAKMDIYSLVQELAENGVSIIVVSSEFPELVSLCDRIYVLHNGKITADFRHGQADEKTLVAYATVNEDSDGEGSESI